MKNLSNITLSLAVLSVFALSSGQAMAEHGKISGSAALSYSKQEASAAPSAGGHMLVSGELTGSNKNTGGTDFMSDANVDNREVGQLFQGNGPHTGYYTMSKDGNTTTALWKGDVSTVLADDGSPRTSFKGTWEYVAGTGKYSGIQGKGKYNGYFTSKTTYTVDWNGEYSLK
ncbi:hypothetical protein [Methylotenera sp.]|uniref:hypothetical protein n=1 Tax=Methylotenera sp. TaxID=2051956 RepID=UPI002730C840|nr:hypothetical protein [Methylotenera sp.]MDP2072045.1 hypothetical protein [Methylotenera sp.]MDP2230630.1 hypothetical protein [Methylotenera sp.]MDP3006946.1 hypothetical protein [Methylotenera sp.]MDP3007117.1 hypothetical protein [Methylotenera sp.]MDP3140676.1 hypothetical protein [Methylotenera sp.]